MEKLSGDHLVRIWSLACRALSSGPDSLHEPRQLKADVAFIRRSRLISRRIDPVLRAEIDKHIVLTSSSGPEACLRHLRAHPQSVAAARTIYVATSDSIENLTSAFLGEYGGYGSDSVDKDADSERADGEIVTSVTGQLTELLALCQNVTSVLIDDWTYFHCGWRPVFAPTCSMLHVSYSDHDAAALLAIFARSPQVTHLSLGGYSRTGKVDWPAKLAHVRSLKLYEGLGLGEVALEQTLTALDVVVRDKDVDTFSTSIKALTQLRSLRLGVAFDPVVNKAAAGLVLRGLPACVERVWFERAVPIYRSRAAPTYALTTLIDAIADGLGTSSFRLVIAATSAEIDGSTAALAMLRAKAEECGIEVVTVAI